MKKTFLALCLLALCITFYAMTQANATVNTMPLTPDNTKQTTPTTPNNNTPTSTPNLRTCGDNIVDPRPKMVRYPIEKL
jgi:hypothetical protein